MQLLYASRQVVAILLPPDSAPVPVALVELQEDVICCASSSSSSSSNSSSSSVALTKSSYAGRELVELEQEVHVYERAGGTCRVAGANITRAVCMTKMYSEGRTVFVLEADEWDTLALQTPGSSKVNFNHYGTGLVVTHR
jgi:hypothetical protein